MLHACGLHRKEVKTQRGSSTWELMYYFNKGWQIVEKWPDKGKGGLGAVHCGIATRKCMVHKGGLVRFVSQTPLQCSLLGWLSLLFFICKSGASLQMGSLCSVFRKMGEAEYPYPLSPSRQPLWPPHHVPTMSPDFQSLSAQNNPYVKMACSGVTFWSSPSTIVGKTFYLN